MKKCLDELDNTIMVAITFLLPPQLLNQVNDLVRRGRYANRSEAIRCAIYDLVHTEYDMVNPTRPEVSYSEVSE